MHLPYFNRYVKNEFMDLTDHIDHLIIMHRDSHFSGLFEEMVNYYKNDNNIGIHPDIELERIYELNYYENKTGVNLSDLLLNQEEKEKVIQAKKAYQDLKKIYEIEETSSSPRLIADLIFSEEEEPQEILDKIIGSQKTLLPDLLRILKWDEAYDSLFPGYGYAPYFVLQALMQIKDPQTIVPLFETLKRDPFIGDEAIVSALYAQGNEAKSFLIKIMKGRPITQDNSYAAYALSVFSPDKDIENEALTLLKNAEIWKENTFCSYLLPLCEKNTDELRKLCENPLLPQMLKKEIEQSIKK